MNGKEHVTIQGLAILDVLRLRHVEVDPYSSRPFRFRSPGTQ